MAIEGETCASIGKGLVVLLGFGNNDTAAPIPKLARKLAELRIFEDAAGKMNLSALEVQAELLVISQFTLYADCRRGRRPDFISALEPKQAEILYDSFVEELRCTGLKVRTGRFSAYMQVSLVNDGPVTIMLDSDQL